MGRLSDKVVIVTGGANGLGEAHSRLFIKEGAKVVLTDIDETKGNKLAEKLGENALFVKHDVANKEDWEKVVKKTEEVFGQINGLVNNAGITGPNDKTLENVTDEEFYKVIDINLYSVFTGMKSVLNSMREVGNGSIVNVSSTSGLVGSVNVSSYVTTKFAVRGLTKAAALEFADDKIRVKSVHPGGIQSNIEVFDAVKEATPMKRIAEAEEVSYMILYLLSDESTFTTGAEFAVDGGFTAQ